MPPLNHSAAQEARPDDSRRFARYRYVKGVSIGIMRGDALSYASGYCLNLGEGGMAVRECMELNIGEIVGIRIELPVGPLRVPACVRYRNGSSYGFEFLGLGIPERDYIRSACKSLEELHEGLRRSAVGSCANAQHK